MTLESRANWISTKSLAEQVGVCPQTLLRYHSKGLLPTIKPVLRSGGAAGKTYLWPPDSLEAVQFVVKSLREGHAVDAVLNAVERQEGGPAATVRNDDPEGEGLSAETSRFPREGETEAPFS